MANEKRLIDANAFKVVLEEIRQDYLEEDTFSSDFAACVIETVEDEYLSLAPTVDAVEVVHGRWIESTNTAYMMSQFTCSECGDKYIAKTWNYCPNCGAKMDGDGNG